MNALLIGYLSVVSIITVGTLLGAGAQRATRKRQLSAVVERFGLQLARDGAEVRLDGRHGDRRVALVIDPQGRVSLTIRSPGGLHQGVRLGPQLGMNGPGSTELQVGHRAFDPRYYLEGSDDEIAAMLSARARRLMTGSRKDVIKVAVGQLSVERAGLPWLGLADWIGRYLELFDELALGDQSVPDRLLHNATQDPYPDVRETNVRLLLKHHGKTDAGRRAIELAGDYDDPELRLLAIAAMPQERALSGLYEMARDDRLPDRYRLRALSLARPMGPLVRDELERTLKSPGCRGEVLSTAAEHVGRLGLVDLLPLLRERAPAAMGVEAVGFCRTFALLRDLQAEPALLQILQHGDDQGQEAAAQALAEVGTVRAVQPLLEQTTGVLRSTRVKSAARLAVQSIQSRLQEADVGDLAIVQPDDDEGELTLADEPGDLALADDD